MALLAVFALSAVMASAAQAISAPFFTISGTRLTAGKTHNFDAKAFENFVLTTPGLGVRIECTGSNVEKGVLLGSNAGLPGKDDEIAVFSGCRLVEGNGEPNCEVTSPIITHPLTSELVEVEGTKEPLAEEYKPTTGTTFVELAFTGSGCTLRTAAVEGEVAARVLTDNGREEAIELGQTPKEATSWLVNFPRTTITEVLLVNTEGKKETHKLESFTVLGSASTLEGTVLTLLANSKFGPERTTNWSPLP